MTTNKKYDNDREAMRVMEALHDQHASTAELSAFWGFYTGCAEYTFDECERNEWNEEYQCYEMDDCELVEFAGEWLSKWRELYE